ncbi:MAG: protein kinase [Deltaproteobacteria bacterium]|nr:protein kinase [Deltaproteobacteria bacterium]
MTDKENSDISKLKKPVPATDPGSHVPEIFHATMSRAQNEALDGQSPVGASIMPEDLDLPVEDAETKDIPIEKITREGKQVLLSDSGEPAFGKPTDQSHYELLDILGRGGMGVVVSARQESLKREVALKIARKVSSDAGSTTSGMIEFFANEAYVTAGLDHPNVVPVYTLAKDPRGHLFFTMKRVSGVEWEQVLNPRFAKKPAQRKMAEEHSAKMTFDDHLGVLMKVSDAVAYAHSKKILHRDLKPENVMIGAFGEVLLMDWGLAMGFGDKNPYLLDPDKVPQLVGTPGFLAPEQATGRMKEFCEATDVYQLGGILYRLLTGHSPHWDKQVMAAVHKAAKGKVEPLQNVSDNPEINPEISRIVNKALARKIKDRYQTVLEFQEDLKRYRANAESMTIANDAENMLTDLVDQLNQAGSSTLDLTKIDKEKAAVAYGKLSECIGAYKQAIKLWSANQPARQGRLEALTLQIELAMQQGDLTLAKAHLEMLEEVGDKDISREWSDQVKKQRKKLESRLHSLTRRKETTERREKVLRLVIFAFIGLTIGAIAGGFYLIIKQKELAMLNLRATEGQRDLMQENLRLSEQMQKKAFAQAVAGRAALVSQYMQDIEHVVAGYRAEAVRLMSIPAGFLPKRLQTAAGRDGFYLDHDYYSKTTVPQDVALNPKYGFAVSKAQVTTVLAPWAKKGKKRQLALKDARRLTRLNTLFSQTHQARDDILWSLTGSKTGILASFPGSGRFAQKPDYDPTRRAWYLGSIEAIDDKPRWVHPHIDAGGQGLIISCTSRINVKGATVGVVGLEVAMTTIQDMLQQFTRSAGPGARGLLVRPDGKVIIDTQYAAGSKKWQEKFKLASIEEVSKELASYYKGALAGQLDATTGLEIDMPAGKKLLAYARLTHPDWLLIVSIDRNAVIRKER